MKREPTLMGSAVAFGRDMLRTQDLDPVYDALVRLHSAAILRRPNLARWCVAYWLFYHVGLASKASSMSNKRFWEFLDWAARNSGPDAPRASERRHFRGEAAPRAVYSLSQQQGGNPLRLVESWGDWNNGQHFSDVQKVVGDQYLFGPWITFKVADMLERVWAYQVNFDDCHLDMYREPLQGGALVLHSDPKAPIQASDLRGVVSHIQAKLRASKLDPPGWATRPVGLQEVETVLCKFKGHWKGHYPVGHDIRVIRAAADPERWGRVAGAFRDAMPEEVEERWHV